MKVNLFALHANKLTFKIAKRICFCSTKLKRNFLCRKKNAKRIDFCSTQLNFFSFVYVFIFIFVWLGAVAAPVDGDNGTRLAGPQKVELPVGAYCVIARANGYGVVTVPVIIQADQVTTVHLEGSPAWQNGSQLSQSNPVRLPDGEIAGWRAPSADTTKP